MFSSVTPSQWLTEKRYFVFCVMVCVLLGWVENHRGRRVHPAAPAAKTHSLMATIETLLTPYFFVAPWAFFEMNWYWGFSFTLFTRSPAASIAET